MSRQDIAMDAPYGEMETTGQVAGKAIAGFSFMPFNGTHCYGEAVVPPGFRKDHLYLYIPYRAENKPLKICIRYDHLSSESDYLPNPVNGGKWYEVTSRSHSIPVCMLRTLNENQFYRLEIRESVLEIYSGEDTDMQIKASLSQNELFLLKASAGNIYQHPTTGVGLIDFLHGNFENTNLAAKLKSEFENDKMTINNAYMDSATGELYLEVKENGQV